MTQKDNIGMNVVDGAYRWAEVDGTIVIDNRPRLDAERNQLTLFPVVYETIRIPRSIFSQIASAV